MAMIGEIGAYLKADTSDFKSKMADAGQSAEKLDKDLKKFGLGFGGIAAAATAFRAIVDYARDLKDPLDENLKRAQAFAKGLDETKAAMLEVGAKAMGVVNGLGEWLGKKIAIAKYGKEQVAQAEAIEKQTIETLKAIEKDKKLTEEIAKLRQQARVVEEKATEEANKQLDIKQQIVLQESKLQAARDALARTDGDRLATAKAELGIATERSALEKLYADDKKKSAEAEKKAADELAKTTEKTAGERAKLADRLLEKQMESMTLEQQIATLKAKESQITKDIVIAGAETSKGIDLQNQLLDVQSALSKHRLTQAERVAAVEATITAELNKQAAVRARVAGIVKKPRTTFEDVTFLEGELEAANKAVETAALANHAGAGKAAQAAYSLAVQTASELDQTLRTARATSGSEMAGKTYGFGQYGRDDKDLSDRVLDDKIRTLSRSIQDRQRRLRESAAPDPMTGAGGYDPLLPHELAEAQRAKDELAARNRVRSLVGSYGETGAQRFYGGNLPEFERLLQFAAQPPELKRVGDTLASIEERMERSGLFGKR